jgi:membrane carboxypeptidase/penicillin-binding protein
VSYMQRAVEGRPEPEFSPPESLELEKKTVDTKTGKLASSGSKTAAAMWFKKGTAPAEVAQDKKVVDPNQFMQVPN